MRSSLHSPAARPPDTAQPTLHIGEGGLFFGSTRLVRMAVHGRSLAIGRDSDRCIALLSIAYRLPVSADFLRHVEAAALLWQRKDPATANLRLLFTGLPRLADLTAVTRVQLAEFCLENGMSPAALLEELGITGPLPPLRKFDREQPRVSAGNGRASGQWIKEFASFLRATPEILAALARFVARFSTPTAVLGALLIPTPNSGGVTSGTLPGAPNVTYEKDDPAGRLRLSAKAADGSTTTVEAQLQRGLYVDVSSGTPIGRDLGGQLYLDLDSVRKVVEDAQPKSARGEPDEKPKAGADEPRLCPAPTPDTPHGASDDANAYEDQVHQRVNPLAPLPSGFAIRLIDPLTDKPIFFEDCFRYAGDLVDNDMKIGDLVEAKGPRAGRLYDKPFSDALARDVAQAEKELRAADARGAGLKWYFSDQDAAEKARAAFEAKGLDRIVIGVMPLRKTYGRLS